MTRDEAISKIGINPAFNGVDHWLVASLEALGLLKLETPADKDHIAAINYLRLHGYPSSADVIIEVLVERGGFKITREPT